MLIQLWIKTQKQKVQMRSLLFLLFIVFISAKCHANSVILRVFTRNELSVKKIEFLAKHYNLEFLSPPPNPSVPDEVLLSVHDFLCRKVERKLRRWHIPFQLVYKRAPGNIKTLIQSDRHNPEEYFSYHDYHDYSELTAELKNLATLFGDRISLFSIGDSYERREVLAVKLGSKIENKKREVVIQCGSNPSEWISVAACFNLINKLIQTDSTTFEKFDVVVIPVLNPDGYIHSWRQDRFWRKNRSKSNCSLVDSCRGVDLNRNFGSDELCWGSSWDPCNDTYCGDGLFSEPESIVLRDFLEKDTLAAFFSVQLFSDVESNFLLYPFQDPRKMPRNIKSLKRLALLSTKAIYSNFRIKYDFGTIANKVTASSGSIPDFVFESLRVPYVFAVQFGQNRHLPFITKNKIDARGSQLLLAVRTILERIK